MKIYLSNLNESWIVDRFRKEWYSNNLDISTKFISRSTIIWIISPWTWKNISKKYLESKKVICSIHHIDFAKFTKLEENNFYARDYYVDTYHVFSYKTKTQLEKLTKKNIYVLPYWINNKIWYEKVNKLDLRKKYSFNQNDFLVGSFQRDTEGSDLISPKLIKGPDIFLEITRKIIKNNPNLKIVLTGKRRNYVIKGLKEYNIPFSYFEMVNNRTLNELYNVLDLYLVTSRVEGGPQAILECGISKVPILSTDVGVASEILHKKSIFEPKNFFNAETNTEFAYQKCKELVIPDGMKPYREMFTELNEN